MSFSFLTAGGGDGVGGLAAYRPMTRFGTNRTISGQRAETTTDRTSARNGRHTARVNSFTVMPAIWQVMNIVIPTGGVIRPIMVDSTNTRPKWTGSMPAWATIGARTGVISTSIVVSSIAVPSTSVTAAIRSRVNRGDVWKGRKSALR